MKRRGKNHKKGQTTMEYILLLAVIVSIVLIGFKTYLPRTQNATINYFNSQAADILGPPPP